MIQSPHLNSNQLSSCQSSGSPLRIVPNRGRGHNKQDFIPLTPVQLQIAVSVPTASANSSKVPKIRTGSNFVLRTRAKSDCKVCSSTSKGTPGAMHANTHCAPSVLSTWSSRKTKRNVLGRRSTGGSFPGLRRASSLEESATFSSCTTAKLSGGSFLKQCASDGSTH